MSIGLWTKYASLNYTVICVVYIQLRIISTSYNLLESQRATRVGINRQFEQFTVYAQTAG